jgi:type IX secretion system PorP/SprF family membrane protein
MKLVKKFWPAYSLAFGKNIDLRSVMMVALMSVIGQASLAQQKPQYTQYVLNNFLLNPAVAGVEDYTDIKLGYRRQWSGLSGAPTTSFLTANLPLTSEVLAGDAASGNLTGDDASSVADYVSSYQAAASHHGLGVSFLTDKAGALSNTLVSVSYAYHIAVAPKINLSAGVSGGFNNSRINMNDLVFENSADPVLVNMNTRRTSPDVAAGLWLYSAQWYVGVSAQQLVKTSMFTNASQTYSSANTSPHFFATTGMRFFLSDEVTIMPSVLVKKLDPAPVSFDINTKLAFQNRFWIGGSYRRNDSFSAMTGFTINSLFNFGYAYDMRSSNINRFSNGTHEFVLGLMLNNKLGKSANNRSF